MLTSLAPHASTRRAFRAVTAATFWSIVVGVGIAAAQVGDAWTEFQGGPAKTGAAAEGPEPGYRLAWRAPIEPGGPGDRFGLSAPLVAGDFVVAVGAEAVIGVDLATGEQAFTVDRDLGPSVPAAAAASGGRTAIVYTEGWGGGPPPAPGADASPTTSSTPAAGAGNGDVVVDSHLAAFDLGNREPLWPPVRLDGVSRTGVTVDSGAAFVGVNDGTVTAVDLADGSVAWRQELEATLVTPLAAVDGSVLVGLQGDRDTQPVIVALDAGTGEERWRHEPTATSTVVSAVSSADGSVYAIFAGISETSVVALDLTDGTQRWSRRVNAAFDVIAPPVVDAQMVFVTDLIGHTRALDAGTGEQRWDFAQNGAVFRSVPVLVGGSLLVPTLEGELGAIDAETGELIWRLPADGAPLRSLAPAGDVLVAVRGGVRSGIEAFEHDPDAVLVREPSPTTLATGRMLGAIAIAAIPLLIVVLLLGRRLTPRLGPAFPDDAGPASDDDEPVRDPWEDEDPTP
ncbi:MAG: outer membrane protein assembly factor BamB family protein [Actinomycetota bacterium]